MAAEPHPPIPWSLEEPDPAILAGVERFEQRARRRLLPKLELFSGFQVRFAQAGALGQNVLGQYVWGSCREPLILLDVHLHRTVASREQVNFWRLLRTTIVHELGHAVQEWHGLPYNDRQAESFALGYVEIGVIDRFWERPCEPDPDNIPFRRWSGGSS